MKKLAQSHVGFGVVQRVKWEWGRIGSVVGQHGKIGQLGQCIKCTGSVGSEVKVVMLLMYMYLRRNRPLIT